MPDCSAIKQNLDDANAALQRLMTGSQVVVIVDAFRTRVEYKPSDSAALSAYIATLQAQYDACINPGGPVTPITKPVNFLF